ncbi:protein ORF91 [Anguillid herpesvirus 1]|uniref:Protein ORF91 n=1 Tax=Anguillid herpesvirus 1 TaxID=150286 RepID=A0A1J0REI2_9VIRU|nr:protein ORF91 [Anguillid herpesvirus 1]ADA57854.1 protein ORF91 [Anguillid herpesvirus 1]APD76253.1 ORF91 [Anguillid herpesvirus 1]QRM16384.1 protein ORF91 [Anguillid herpesvirus 1]QRM16643.1 protein ORF91 [Anguillid herpesvirus 1]QRM16776.1 protein ORF91 [Anguillid herpesvirus 1]
MADERDEYLLTNLLRDCVTCWDRTHPLRHRVDAKLYDLVQKECLVPLGHEDAEISTAKATASIVETSSNVPSVVTARYGPLKPTVVKLDYERSVKRDMVLGGHFDTASDPLASSVHHLKYMGPATDVDWGIRFVTPTLSLGPYTTETQILDHKPSMVVKGKILDRDLKWDDSLAHLTAGQMSAMARTMVYNKSFPMKIARLARTPNDAAIGGLVRHKNLARATDCTVGELNGRPVFVSVYGACRPVTEAIVLAMTAPLKDSEWLRKFFRSRAASLPVHHHKDHVAQHYMAAYRHQCYISTQHQQTWFKPAKQPKQPAERKTKKRRATHVEVGRNTTKGRELVTALAEAVFYDGIRALHYLATQLGIYHNNVRLENFGCSSAGRVLLGDFTKSDMLPFRSVSEEGGLETDFTFNEKLERTRPVPGTTSFATYYKPPPELVPCTTPGAVFVVHRRHPFKADVWDLGMSVLAVFVQLDTFNENGTGLVPGVEPSQKRRKTNSGNYFDCEADWCVSEASYLLERERIVTCDIFELDRYTTNVALKTLVLKKIPDARLKAMIASCLTEPGIRPNPAQLIEQSHKPSSKPKSTTPSTLSTPSTTPPHTPARPLSTLPLKKRLLCAAVPAPSTPPTPPTHRAPPLLDCARLELELHIGNGRFGDTFWSVRNHPGLMVRKTFPLPAVELELFNTVLASPFLTRPLAALYDGTRSLTYLVYERAVSLNTILRRLNNVKADCGMVTFVRDQIWIEAPGSTRETTEFLHNQTLSTTKLALMGVEVKLDDLTVNLMEVGAAAISALVHLRTHNVHHNRITSANIWIGLDRKVKLAGVYKSERLPNTAGRSLDEQAVETTHSSKFCWDLKALAEVLNRARHVIAFYKDRVGIPNAATKTEAMQLDKFIQRGSTLDPAQRIDLDAACQILGVSPTPEGLEPFQSISIQVKDFFL